MTRHDGTPSVSHHRVFPAQSLAAFARAYPETPHVLRHGLEADFRLSLDSLAQLGEALPGSSVEYNRGDLPIGVDGKPGATGLTIGDTIRNIATCRSWAVLKNIEQVPEYQALLMGLLAAVCALLLLAPLPAAAMGVIELAVLLNIAWGIFNLLPLFPMDGGQALAYGLQSVVNPLTAWTVAHVMGLVVAVGLALYAFKAGSLWIALIVGMFAYQNWQGLQHIQQLKKQRER